MKYLFSALVLAAFSNISALTPPKPVADLSFGSVTDPEGDATEDDLVYASVKVDASSNVTFEVHFSRSSFVAGSSAAIFFLDTDRQAGTGHSGITNDFKDRVRMGVDVQVNLTDLKTKEAGVYFVVGTSEARYEPQPTKSGFETLDNGYRLVLPMLALNFTKGPEINFKVSSLRAGSPAGARDTMPDIGQPVGMVRNPALIPKGAPHRPMGADYAIPFREKWYAVYLEPKTWNDAREACKGKHGQLAIVADKETWEFIKNLNYDKAGGAPLWLGATDAKTEGTWEWIDGAPFDFTAWGAGHLDNPGGKEDYLHTLGKDGWNAANNGGELGAKRVAGFICEWEDR